MQPFRSAFYLWVPNTQAYPTSPPPSSSPIQRKLRAAVNLLGHVARRPRVPLVARALHRLGDAHLPHRLGLHDKRREEAARRVPGDVAVEAPDARVGVE